MSFDFQLQWETPPAWADAALTDVNALLADHAACERKASANALSFVSRYSDRTVLVGRMIQLAREELRHFHDVYRLLQQRGASLQLGAEDHYAQALVALVRHPSEERFLDRLIVSGLIEARSHERLALLAERFEDELFRRFYARLARAEAAHRTLFFELALEYFPEATVRARLEQFLGWEATAIRSQPFGPRIH